MRVLESRTPGKGLQIRTCSWITPKASSLHGKRVLGCNGCWLNISCCVPTMSLLCSGCQCCRTCSSLVPKGCPGSSIKDLVHDWCLLEESEQRKANHHSCLPTTAATARLAQQETGRDPSPPLHQPLHWPPPGKQFESSDVVVVAECGHGQIGPARLRDREWTLTQVISRAEILLHTVLELLDLLLGLGFILDGTAFPDNIFCHEKYSLRS